MDAARKATAQLAFKDTGFVEGRNVAIEYRYDSLTDFAPVTLVS